MANTKNTGLIFSISILLVLVGATGSVEADAGGNTESQATVIPTGVTYSYVCWDDACTYGEDQYDYHKFYVYYGDKAYLKFENTCDIDYTEADVKVKISSTWSQEYRLQCDDTVTWNYNIQRSTNGYVYLRVEGIEDGLSSAFGGDDQGKIKITMYIDDDDRDRDYDGYDDDIDHCDYDAGDSFRDVTGCPDVDNDGWSNDYGDDCPYDFGGVTNDRNGCPDYDSDGWSDEGDDCPNEYGGVTNDRNGCPDYDDDGWSDEGDACPYDSSEYLDTDDDTYCDGKDWKPNDGTQWEDNDGDGYGDNKFGNQGDHFPGDRTQWFDNDEDGFGDNPDGNNPDHCRFVKGYSDEDRNGCPDYDGDGWSDPDSDHPAHPVGDADAFQYDGLEWRDTDSDDYGDNRDMCPAVAGTSGARISTGSISQYGIHAVEIETWGEHFESPDLYADWDEDQEDVYFDEGGDMRIVLGAGSNQYWQIWMGCTDTDGDGFEDVSDAFPEDNTQWSDADGDGFGDNLPHPTLQSYDSETCQNYLRNLENTGSTTENIRHIDRVICTVWGAENYAFFDFEFNSALTPQGQFSPTSRYHYYQDFDIGWAIPGAVNGDACPLQPGTSTLDRYGCPDTDGDGWSDATADWTIENGADTYKNDSTQHIDTDGDGYGDNSSGLNGDACPTDEGYSTIDRLGCPDMDTDGYSDERGDGLGGDDCPAAYGDSTRDRFGCPDSNGDGYSDMNGFMSTTVAKAFDDGDVASIFILIIPVIVLMGLSVFLLKRRKGGGKGGELDQYSLNTAMQDAVAWGMEEGSYQAIASTTVPAPPTPPLTRTTPIPEPPIPKSANDFHAGPDLPAGGLPEGWTMEDWATYGDDWLQQNQGRY